MTGEEGERGESEAVGWQKVAVLIDGVVARFTVMGGFIAAASDIVEGEGRGTALEPARAIGLHLIQD